MFAFVYFRVDSMIALQILAEAAKSSLQAMRTLHNMARGFRAREEAQSPPASTRTESSGKFVNTGQSTVLILSCRTDWTGQTVYTQKEQPDQGLHCLPFCLQLLDTLFVLSH